MEIALQKGYKATDFDEMYKPVLYMDQAHDKAADDISKLELEAGEWEKLADSAIDKDSYEQYKSYADKLRDTSARLAQSGIDRKILHDIHDLRGQFSSTILPLKQSEAKRNQWLDEQRKLQAQDASMRFNKDPQSISLREFIDNPNLNYTPLSGNQIKQDMQNTVQHFKNKIIEEPSKWSHALGATYERMITRGYSIEDVYAVIEGKEDADPVLRDLYQNALEIYGIDEKEFFEPDAQYLKNKLAEGLYAAVGSDDIDKVNVPIEKPSRTGRSSGSGSIKIPDSLGFSPVEKDYLSIEASEVTDIIDTMFSKEKDVYRFFGEDLKGNPYDNIDKELKKLEEKRSQKDRKGLSTTSPFYGPSVGTSDPKIDGAINKLNKTKKVLEDAGVKEGDTFDEIVDKLNYHHESSSMAYTALDLNFADNSKTSASLLAGAPIKNGKVPNITKVDSNYKNTGKYLTKKEYSKLIGTSENNYQDNNLNGGIRYMQSGSRLLIEDNDGNLYQVNPRQVFPNGVNAALEQSNQYVESIKRSNYYNRDQKLYLLKENQFRTAMPIADLLAKGSTPVGGKTSNKQFTGQYEGDVTMEQIAEAFRLYELGDEEYKAKNKEQIEQLAELLEQNQ